MDSGAIRKGGDKCMEEAGGGGGGGRGDKGNGGGNFFGDFFSG